jgi:hypothetical protein
MDDANFDSPNDLDQLAYLAQQGYAMLERVFDRSEIDALAERLTEALESRSEPSILRSRGETYGSRNLLEVFPDGRRACRPPAAQ